MRKVSSREARRNFSDIINRARYAHEQTIITSNGRQVAAIVSMDDLKIINAALDAISSSKNPDLLLKRWLESESESENGL